MSTRPNGAPRDAWPHDAGGATFAPRDGDRVLFLAPHPDDESLAAGGLLQAARAAGAALRVCYFTDGENNPWAQLVTEGRWPLRAADRERWGRRRRAEALAALAELGVPAEAVVRLGLPDQGLDARLLAADPAPLAALLGALRAFAPTHLVLPAPADLHPDHNAIAVLGAFALARLATPARPAQVLHYVVHGAPPGPGGVVLDAEAQARKRRAIFRHASQLRWHHRWFHDFVRPLEPFAPAAPAQRGEPAHPLREAALAPGTLELALAPRRRGGFGPAVVRVALLDRAGALHARSAPLPAHAARLALELPPEAAVACFAKLEWPLERRLGCFDRCGWRAVPVPEPAPAGSAPAEDDRALADPPGVALRR